MASGLIEQDRSGSEKRLQVTMMIWEEIYDPIGYAPFTSRVFYDCINLSHLLLGNKKPTTELLMVGTHALH